MRARWGLVMLPSFALVVLLLVVPQFVFLRGSFFEDVGLGRLGTEIILDNYIEVFSDPYFRDSLFLTGYISLIATVLSLAWSYAAAYILARMRSRYVPLLLAATVLTALISLIITALGLIIIFGADGPINQPLKSLGIIQEQIKVVGQNSGVIIGIMHFVLPFMILVLYGVFQTIPRHLEEAAQSLGASWWRTIWRIIIPLSLPGVLATSLIVFNLSMGSFVSAAILGGGKIFTLPFLVWRTLMLENSYAMGATLAAVLLISVMLINLLSVYLIFQLRAVRRMAV